MRVLIADRHKLFLDALTLALGQLEKPVEIVESLTLESAIEQLGSRDDIDLAVLDLHLTGMKGIKGVEQFTSCCPDIPVAVISGHHTSLEIYQAFELGAVGFLPKSLGIGNLVPAFELMASGQRFIPPDVLTAAPPEPRLIEAPEELQRFCTAQSPCDLTLREQEVLFHLMEGLSNKGIARALDVREVTVKVHLQKIFRKLGATNRVHAVILALQNGWAPDSPYIKSWQSVRSE